MFDQLLHLNKQVTFVPRIDPRSKNMGIIFFRNELGLVPIFLKETQ